MPSAHGESRGLCPERRGVGACRRLVTARMEWSPRRMSADRQLCGTYRCVPLLSVATSGAPLRAILDESRRFVSVFREGLRFCAFPAFARERFAAGRWKVEWTERGDVLLAESHGRLLAEVVEDRFAGYPVQGRTKVVRPKEIDPHWLAALFVSKPFRRYLDERNPVGLSAGDVLSCMIPECPREIQRACVDEMERLLSANRRKEREVLRLSDELETGYWESVRSRKGDGADAVRMLFSSYASWVPRERIGRRFLLNCELIPVDSLERAHADVRRDFVELTLRLPSFRARARRRPTYGGQSSGESFEAVIPVPRRDIQDQIVRRLRPVLDRMEGLSADLASRDDIRSSVISRVVFNEAD